MANMTSDTVRAAGEAGLSSRATSAAGEAAARHSHAGHAALVQDERVHSSIYTDPAIFADEMANIFERCWIFVGHDSEIPNPGDFRTRKIGKQPVLFVRGRDGVARVLMNRCTHRGVQLCIEDRGNASRFTCPYHAWTFLNTGDLIGVPYPERYENGVEKAEFGLRPVPRVAEYRGFTFASLSADGPSLDDYLGPLVKAEIDIAVDLSPVGRISVSAGTHKFGYDGNWKLQAENSVDAYHLNFLHQSFLQITQNRAGVDGRGMGTSGSPALIRSLGNGHVSWDTSPMGMELQFIGSDGSKDDWRENYKAALIERHGIERARFLWARSAPHVLIFPNLVLISSQIRVIQPIAADRTEVFLMPSLLEGVPDELNQQRLRGHEAFYGPAGGGATDDMEIFERQMSGFRATVDPWIYMGRGVGMEQARPDGSVEGQITDELGSRAFLRQWKAMMTAA